MGESFVSRCVLAALVVRSSIIGGGLGWSMTGGSLNVVSGHERSRLPQLKARVIRRGNGVHC